MKTFIIAEAGVNHNGSLECAKRLVDAAAEAGVDCVKFQTFKSENLVSSRASKAEYQKVNTGNDDSQLSMLKKLELSFGDFIELKGYCENKGIMFLSTAFDLESADFLASLGMQVWKVPSGEITNLPLLERIAKTGKDIIMSTGMADETEISEAVKVLSRGGGRLTLLHCTTEYPAPLKDVNLKAMLTLGEKYNVPFGYSDHTKGITVSVAAAALGATVLEKHFTLDKTMDGPDHKASLEPDELKELVRAVREVEAALGDGIKRPAESEVKNKSIARKCIVAKRDINKGEEFTEENITTKRAGEGISPMKWYSVLGTKAVRDFEADEPIEI